MLLFKVVMVIIKMSCSIFMKRFSVLHVGDGAVVVTGQAVKSVKTRKEE